MAVHKMNNSHDEFMTAVLQSHNIHPVYILDKQIQI